jgi:hypothetical protein
MFCRKLKEGEEAARIFQLTQIFTKIPSMIYMLSFCLTVDIFV